MTRRLLLILPLAACLRADSQKEVEDLIAAAVSALSAGNAEQFLGLFDPAMPEFAKLREGVNGLLSQAELTCSIEVESNEGGDEVRLLKLDWLLRIDFKDRTPDYDRRQKTVTCKFTRIGKKWKIVAFDPVSLFGPTPG